MSLATHTFIAGAIVAGMLALEGEPSGIGQMEDLLAPGMGEVHQEPVTPTVPAMSSDDLHCMVLAIYHEARGESALGQRAVAHVIMNRVKSPAYPDTVCDVVFQDRQFEFTQDGRSDAMTDELAVEQAVRVALDAGNDVTGGAVHFYAHNKVAPAWRHVGDSLIIGNHTFLMARR